MTVSESVTTSARAPYLKVRQGSRLSRAPGPRPGLDGVKRGEASNRDMTNAGDISLVVVLTCSHASIDESLGGDQSGPSADDDVAGNGSAKSWGLLFARRIRCRVQRNVNDLS